MSRRRKRRKRSRRVAVTRAEFEHITLILNLCREHGEGNVDFRQSAALEQAIAEGNFILFIDLDSRRVIGCAAVYPYSSGGRLLNELGTSVFVPEWRGLGLVNVSVALRSLHAMMSEPGSICVSELYLRSVKSKAVLERNGFTQVEPDEHRAAHAAAVSPEPVIHMELQVAAVPYLASLLLEIVEGPLLTRDGEEIQVTFVGIYWLSTPSGLRMLAELAAGDLHSIMSSEEPRDDAPDGEVPAPPRPPRPPKQP